MTIWIKNATLLNQKEKIVPIELVLNQETIQAMGKNLASLN